MTEHAIGDIKVTPGALEVLDKLHHEGPTSDEDLPCTVGMAELVTLGIAKRDYTKTKKNLLTDKGTIVAALHYRDHPKE